MPIKTGGIIAAGDGRRLKQGGIPYDKPLVPVAGFPLIGHSIKNLDSVGVKRIVIIFNEQEVGCVHWVQVNFPNLNIEFIVKSTQSSYESFWRVGQKLGAGRHLISTVDSLIAPNELEKMVQPSGPAEAVYLGLTTFVDDENPLRVDLDLSSRKILEIGKDSGAYVTAGYYNVPDSVFSSGMNSKYTKLRHFLRDRFESHGNFYGVPLSKVVDVDHPNDIKVAEELLKRREFMKLLAIARESDHSPNREFDDYEILRLTAQNLERSGFKVDLKKPQEVLAQAQQIESQRPDLIFMMCEEIPILDLIHSWEKQGTIVINSVEAVRNTYRYRTVPLLEKSDVPFPQSELVATAGFDLKKSCFYDGPGRMQSLWVKRVDVHNCQEGDVTFSESAPQVESLLSAFNKRGIDRAVLQEHIPGDLIKFYGIGNPAQTLRWFKWFYHKNQVLKNYKFDEQKLQTITQGAARALGVEVFGGDAIVTESGSIYVIDLNAWPSFALFRAEAAPKIAAHIASRLEKKMEKVS